MTARQFVAVAAALVVLTAVVALAVFGLGRQAWCPAPVGARPRVLAVPSAEAVPWLGPGRPWAPAAPPPVGELAVLAQVPPG